MSNSTASDVKKMLKEFAERCKEYRILEINIEKASSELNASERKILNLETEISELEKEAGNLNIVDLKPLEQEVLDLSLEREQLGFFAFKRRRIVSSLLQSKRDELQAAQQKNRLIETITKKKHQLAYWSDYEGKRQAELKAVLEEVSQSKIVFEAAIEKCVEALLNIPADVLFYVLSETGVEMMHLPYVVLKKAISKGIPAFMKEMPVQQQVKLLYQYDTPIHFGGREWNVLHVQNDKALLLLHGAYVYGAFYRGDTIHVSWKDSDARHKLNNEFIQSLTLKQNENILAGCDGDKVFCLSKSEVEKYLASTQRRVQAAWWLRDTSYYSGGEFTEPRTDAYYVSMFGEIDYTKCNNTYNNLRDMQSMCLRPALWVELPYDSLDKEWNAKNIDVNCKGMWTSENRYSRVSVSFSSLTQSKKESSGFTDADAWHAIASGMMGGGGIDGTGN